MFPTTTRLATCLNNDDLCRCDICWPVHCQDCAENFQDIDAYHRHIRRPSPERHLCAYCQEPFMRRGGLIKHYESDSCRTPLTRALRFIDTRLYDHDPLLARSIRQLVGYPYQPPSAIATQQSWHSGIKRYKCYLCRPVQLGFFTLDCLNEHLTSHWQRHYKCPHSACNIPFNTIAGLVQHIESRSCRCMTDGNWWCSYILLIDTNPQGRRVEEQPSVWTRLSIVDLMKLNGYWNDIYDEMTGPGGRWDSKRWTVQDWVAEVVVRMLKSVVTATAELYVWFWILLIFVFVVCVLVEAARLVAI